MKYVKTVLSAGWLLASFALMVTMGVVEHRGLIRIDSDMFLWAIAAECVAAVVFGLRSKVAKFHFGNVAAPLIFLAMTIAGTLMAFYLLLIKFGE